MGQRIKKVGVQNVCFRISSDLKKELKKKKIDKWEKVQEGVDELSELMMKATEEKRMQLMKEIHSYNKETKRDATDNLHKVDTYTFWNLTEIANWTYSTRSDVIRYILGKKK